MATENNDNAVSQPPGIASPDELDQVALCILQSLLVAGTIPRQYGAQNGYDYVASAYAMATEVMRFRSGERSR